MSRAIDVNDEWVTEFGPPLPYIYSPDGENPRGGTNGDGSGTSTGLSIGDPLASRSPANDCNKAVCFAFLSGVSKDCAVLFIIDVVRVVGDTGDVGPGETAPLTPPVGIDSRLGDCVMDFPRDRRRARLTEAGAKCPAAEGTSCRAGLEAGDEETVTLVDSEVEFEVMGRVDL